MEKQNTTPEEPAEELDGFSDVFDDVFGGPCWTEECCNCVSDTSSEKPPDRPGSFFCIPATGKISPRQQLKLHARRPSPRLTPVSTPVLQHININNHDNSGELVLASSASSTNGSYYPSDTNVNLLRVPIDTSIELSIDSISSSLQQSSLDFKPATVTPVNLSPVPKSPQSAQDFRCVQELHNAMYNSTDLSSSIENDNVETSGRTFSSSNTVEVQLKETIEHEKNFDSISLPLPIPSPITLIIRREESEEFLRPRIAALQPHCTCLREHPLLGSEIEPIPWVDTSDCKIIRDLYEARTSFHDMVTSSNGHGLMADGRVPPCSSPSQISDGAITARTCLRLHTQPNVQLLTHLFAQFDGFRGISLSPNEDYAFVAYATDAQSNRAKLGLEDLLFSQPNRIHITTVSMDQAVRDVYGSTLRRRPKARLNCCLCCKKKC